MSTSEIASPTAEPRRSLGIADSRWAPLPVLLAGTFMVVLDFFIVNVALPSMQTDLHATAGAIEWVVAGYALTSAVFLITAGRLGDRFGRRRMFSIGLALFTLASAACGAAGSPTVLVIARLVQGVGGRAADAERAVDHRRPLHRRRPRSRARRLRDRDGRSRRSAAS